MLFGTVFWRRARDCWRVANTKTFQRPHHRIRMDRSATGVIEKYQVRVILGKGGLVKANLEAIQKFGTVYLAIQGAIGATSESQNRAGFLVAVGLTMKAYFFLRR